MWLKRHVPPWMVIKVFLPFNKSGMGICLYPQLAFNVEELWHSLPSWRTRPSLAVDRYHDRLLHYAFDNQYIFDTMRHAWAQWLPVTAHWDMGSSMILALSIRSTSSATSSLASPPLWPGCCVTRWGPGSGMIWWEVIMSLPRWVSYMSSNENSNCRRSSKCSFRT